MFTENYNWVVSHYMQFHIARIGGSVCLLKRCCLDHRLWTGIVKIAKVIDTDEHLFINYSFILPEPFFLLHGTVLDGTSQLSHCGVNLHFADPVNDYLRIIGAPKLVPALRRCAWGCLKDCLKCICLSWGVKSGRVFVRGLIYSESARLRQPLSLGFNL